MQAAASTYRWSLQHHRPPQGGADARTLVPHLIELYRQGRFPVGKLVSRYRFAEIQRAIDDMEAGRVIKPILRMTDDKKDKT